MSMNEETGRKADEAEDGATGPVLSEAEVNALVAGVENGEIEVQSAAGPRYATVTDFEVPRRSRIVSDSLPKLDVLNATFAERLKLRSEQALAADLSVEFVATDKVLFGDLVETDVARVMAVEFSVAPLPGHAAFVLDGPLVSKLVELFFGGAANEPRAAGHDAFTAGVMRVIDAYAAVVLDALKATWAGVQTVDPQPHKSESSLSLLGIADESEPVVRSLFEYSFPGGSGRLTVLFPEKVIAPLLPTFKGEKRVPDAERDRRWTETIRDCLPAVSVGLSTSVGQATMTLRQLICLEPGDILSIENPTEATILANNVRLLRGRFGVHGGRNAVAASRWMTTDITNTVKDTSNGQ
jgi:flagellar motor switch protein FliM